jgi:MoaA/NifB/PqqE/SkfB family radical SAM enzyme
MARSIEIVSPLTAVGRLGAPTKAQVILNNRCQLRCEWCWGPEHDKPESGQLQDWQQLIGNLAVAESMPYIAPVNRITVSGGEPLLSRLLIPVLKTAQEYGMRTKLSTNGIFLKRLVEVLPFCDELAVGIDGNSEESHARMRKGSAAHGAFYKAVAAIRLGQEHKKPVTLRTVVAQKNWRVIPTIPVALERAGIDLSLIRHKLYQLEPIGPRKDKFSLDEWGTSTEDVLDIAGRVKEDYPEMNVCVQLYGLTDARYLNFESTGRAYGIDARPPARTPREVEFGDAFSDFDATYATYTNYLVESNAISMAYERRRH